MHRHSPPFLLCLTVNGEENKWNVPCLAMNWSVGCIAHFDLPIRIIQCIIPVAIITSATGRCRGTAPFHQEGNLSFQLFYPLLESLDVFGLLGHRISHHKQAARYGGNNSPIAGNIPRQRHGYDKSERPSTWKKDNERSGGRRLRRIIADNGCEKKCERIQCHPVIMPNHCNRTNHPRREWWNGRHARFRILWSNPWEFESPFPHQFSN